MRALQQILNTLRRILGLSSSLRSTTSGIKRETQHYAGKKKQKTVEETADQSLN